MLETQLPIQQYCEVENSGFFGNSIAPHDFFFFLKAVLLKQTCERTCDILLELTLEKVSDVWEKCK